MHPQSSVEEPSHIHVERPSRAQLAALQTLAEPRPGVADAGPVSLADEQAGGAA
jgi:hypothetical protein